MTVNSKKLTAALVVLSVGFLALGFSWSTDAHMSMSVYPSINAPDTALAGSLISIHAASDVGRLRIIIEDGLGRQIYDSEETCGSYGQLDPTTGLYFLDIGFIIPDDTIGPLTIKVTDALGRENTKSVTVL